LVRLKKGFLRLLTLRRWWCWRARLVYPPLVWAMRWQLPARDEALSWDRSRRSRLGGSIFSQVWLGEFEPTANSRNYSLRRVDIQAAQGTGHAISTIQTSVLGNTCYFLYGHHCPWRPLALFLLWMMADTGDCACCPAVVITSLYRAALCSRRGAGWSNSAARRLTNLRRCSAEA